MSQPGMTKSSGQPAWTLMIDVWEQIQYYKEIIFSNFVAGLKIIV